MCTLLCILVPLCGASHSLCRQGGIARLFNCINIRTIQVDIITLKKASLHMYVKFKSLHGARESSELCEYYLHLDFSYK